ESGEIAELAGAKRKARVVGMLARVAISKCSKQQSTRVRAHVQAVRDERDRTVQQTADNFGDHHRSAEPDNRPRLSFASLVTFTKEHVRVPVCDCFAHNTLT